MRLLPRFAVGTIQPAAAETPALCGLLAALHAAGDRPAVFRSSCVLAGADLSQPLLGRVARHLDSWAMSRGDAASALCRGTGEGETAVITGKFDAARPSPTPLVASSLDRLCKWLDLPRIGVVDVRLLAECGGRFAAAGWDGLLLDRVRDAADAAYWQTTLEALWRAPVIGWLDEAAPLRTACTACPAGPPRSKDFCEAWGARLAPTLRLDKLRSLARRAPPIVPARETAPPLETTLLHSSRRRFRIAVAYDEAYCGYYPETLDLLEAAGAELCDFSPLRCEALPAGVDIVYFGCGHPERHAAQLAANHCLKQSLRCFAAAGGRVYAEGGGLPYLCQEVEFPGGEAVAMTGLLPAVARWTPQYAAAEPAEVAFSTSSWLAPARVALRGYRQAEWQIEPRGSLVTYAVDPRHRLDVLGRGNVIGSRVLVNLAANRHLLRRFFEPQATVLAATRELE